MATNKPRVVSIGGGSGQKPVLRALRTMDVEISAIVTMFDSGGSTGLLKREFGYLPLGDVRQCLTALSGQDAESRSLAKTLQYRFAADSSLNGHALGNLVLSALVEMYSGITGAIAEMSKLLNVRGNVLPVTHETAELKAYLEDGSSVLGESAIDLRRTASPSIDKIELDREVSATEDVRNALAGADLIVLGPGDLYTSVIPNLLPAGMAEALSSAKAPVCYVCNIMTKLGETDGYTAARFVRALESYMGGRELDYVLLNASVPSPESLELYRQEGAEFVESDEKLQQQTGPKVITGDYAFAKSGEARLRHSAIKLAETFGQLLDEL